MTEFEYDETASRTVKMFGYDANLPILDKLNFILHHIDSEMRKRYTKVTYIEFYLLISGKIHASGRGEIPRWISNMN